MFCTYLRIVRIRAVDGLQQSNLFLFQCHRTDMMGTRLNIFKIWSRKKRGMWGLCLGTALGKIKEGWWLLSCACWSYKRCYWLCWSFDVDCVVDAVWFGMRAPLAKVGTYVIVFMRCCCVFWWVIFLCAHVDGGFGAAPHHKTKSFFFILFLNNLRMKFAFIDSQWLL